MSEIHANVDAISAFREEIRRGQLSIAAAARLIEGMPPPGWHDDTASVGRDTGAALRSACGRIERAMEQVGRRLATDEANARSVLGGEELLGS